MTRVLVLCVSTILLSANYAIAQRFRAGFSLGTTISDIDGTDTVDHDNDFHKLGFTAGGLVNMRLNSKNVLQMELNYTQKGSLQPPDSNNMGYYKISLAYIEIPLIIKRRLTIKTSKRTIDKIDLEGGASFGRLISHKVLDGNNYVAASPNSLFNFTDISLHLGLDYNFSDNFYFCFRYSNSVIPVIKRNSLVRSTAIYTFNKGNNMVYQLGFKYVFSAKNKAAGVPVSAD